MKLVISLILCVVFNFTPVNSQFGNKLRDCYKTEKKELYECLVEFFAAIKSELVDENRSPSGQALSKLLLKDVYFPQVDGFFKGVGIWHNYTIRGFEDYKIDKAFIDISKNHVNVDISIANLTGVGIYTLNASVMNSPTNAEGHGNNTVYLLDVTGTLTFTVKSDNGDNEATLEKVELHGNIGKFRALMDGLVGGEQVSKAFVDFISDDKNVAFFNAIRQPAFDEIANSLFEIYKDYFKDFPSEIFAD